MIYILLLLVYFIVYIIIFLGISKRIHVQENEIVQIFLKKVSKIPSFIEVMRPYIHDSSAFERMTLLHSDAMIRNHDGVYDLLEHNARIHDQFLFLMKLSVLVPELQKNAYFLYIRDFIIAYDKQMQSRFSLFNTEILYWNRFISWKNWTLLGLLLPGKKMMQI